MNNNEEIEKKCNYCDKTLKSLKEIDDHLFEDHKEFFVQCPDPKCKVWKIKTYLINGQILTSPYFNKIDPNSKNVEEWDISHVHPVNLVCKHCGFDNSGSFSYCLVRHDNYHACVHCKKCKNYSKDAVKWVYLDHSGNIIEKEYKGFDVSKLNEIIVTPDDFKNKFTEEERDKMAKEHQEVLNKKLLEDPEDKGDPFGIDFLGDPEELNELSNKINNNFKEKGIIKDLGNESDKGFKVDMKELKAKKFKVHAKLRDLK